MLNRMYKIIRELAMFNPSSNDLDIQYRTKGHHLQNEAKSNISHEMKITLYKLAIKQYRQIKNKKDDDMFEISYCYYNIAIIYKTYFNKSIEAQCNFQHAIDYLKSIQHPKHEDNELLKDYYWQLNNTNDNYYVITREEQDSQLNDTANEQDEQDDRIYRCR